VNEYIEVRKIAKVDDLNLDKKVFVFGIAEDRVGVASFRYDQPKVGEPLLNTDFLFAFTSDVSEVFDAYTFLKDSQWIYMDINAKDRTELSALVQRIAKHMQDDIDTKIYKHSLTYLLLKLKWIFTINKLRIKSNGSKSEKIIELIRYMKANQGSDRSVAYYARLIHVSETYLGELCQLELGVSFRSLSTQLLLLRILDSFYHTSISFGGIAGELHFSDQAHFNTFFKKHLGVTPSEFKKGVLI